MNKQEKYNEVAEAMEFKKWDNGKEGYIIRDTCTGDTKQLLMDIIYDERVGGESDLSYEIVAKACAVISEIELKDLKDWDIYENNEDEHASIYNTERLAYLNNWNEGEISDTFKEYNCELISNACAYWYDNMVNNTIEKIRAYILRHD